MSKQHIIHRTKGPSEQAPAPSEEIALVSLTAGVAQLPKGGRFDHDGKSYRVIDSVCFLDGSSWEFNVYVVDG